MSTPHSLDASPDAINNRLWVEGWPRSAEVWARVNAIYREFRATVLIAPDLKQSRPCPLCCGRDHTAIGVQYEFQLVACSKCGHVFVLDPYPSELRQQLYYGFRKYCLEANGYYLREPEAGVRGEFERRPNPTAVYNEGAFLKSVLRYLSQHDIRFGRPQGLTFLDVGCFKGYSVLAAQRLGMRAMGIEFEPLRVEFARRVLNVQVVPKKLEEFEIEARGFDLVPCLGVLEHVNDPIAFIEKARAVLDDSGFMLVRVPNFYSKLDREALERGHGTTSQALDHINYFSFDEVISLLERVGLEVVLAGTEGLDGFDGQSYSIEMAYGLSPNFGWFWRRESKLHRILHQFKNYACLVRGIAQTAGGLLQGRAGGARGDFSTRLSRSKEGQQMFFIVRKSR